MKSFMLWCGSSCAQFGTKYIWSYDYIKYILNPIKQKIVLVQLSSFDDQCVKWGLSLCWYGAIPEKLSFLPSWLESSCTFPHRVLQRSERYLHNTKHKTCSSFWHNFFWPDLIISACLSITCVTWAGSRLPTTWWSHYAWWVTIAYMGTRLISLLGTMRHLFAKWGIIKANYLSFPKVFSENIWWLTRCMEDGEDIDVVNCLHGHVYIESWGWKEIKSGQESLGRR